MIIALAAVLRLPVGHLTHRAQERFQSQLPMQEQKARQAISDSRRAKQRQEQLDILVRILKLLFIVF